MHAGPQALNPCGARPCARFSGPAAPPPSTPAPSTPRPLATRPRLLGPAPLCSPLRLFPHPRRPPAPFHFFMSLNAWATNWQRPSNGQNRQRTPADRKIRSPHRAVRTGSRRAVETCGSERLLRWPARTRSRPAYSPTPAPTGPPTSPPPAELARRGAFWLSSRK